MGLPQAVPALLALFFIITIPFSYVRALTVESGTDFVALSRSLVGPITINLRGVVNVSEASSFSQPIQPPGFMQNGTVHLEGSSEGPQPVLDLGHHFEISVRTCAKERARYLGLQSWGQIVRFPAVCKLP